VGNDSQGLLSTHLSTILDHVSRLGEQGRIPSPALFADRRGGQNALSSFLIQPASSVLAEAFDLSGVLILSNEGRGHVRAAPQARPC
jgi:hypothetical protein